MDINSWGNVITNGGTITLNGGALNLATDDSSNAVSIGLGTTARQIKLASSAAGHTTTIGNTTASTTLDLKFGNDFSYGNAGSSGAISIFSPSNQITRPANTAFLTRLNTTRTNVTGDGTSFTLGSGTVLTEIFDVGGRITTAGVFTANVTGKYQIQSMIRITGCTAATTISINIVTSNRTYTISDGRNASAIDFGIFRAVLCDMDASDTCSITLNTVGEAAVTDDIMGGTTLFTCISGFLPV